MVTIGIIGTGWFSGIHANILSEMEGVKVKAICGTSLEKARTFASSYGDMTPYGNLTQMLDREKLDAVYICVPPFAHGDIESELVARGIPFLVEKPLSVDEEAPSRILDEVRKNPIITSVGYHFRYKNSVDLLRNELRESTLGMATGEWMGSMPEVPWWRNRQTSGGQFIEQTTHLVDLLRYTMGEVKEVYASYANTYVSTQYEGVTVPDVGTVSLKFTNGLIANLSNTCIIPDEQTKIGINYYTNNGVIHLGPDSLELFKNGEKHIMEDVDNPYVLENKAFIHAVRTGDTSGILSTYEDAFKTLKVTVAAQASADSGQVVKVSE
ncbi:Gfo/Idh/MocA family protein [Metabacillus sp. HB246100]